MARLKSSGCGFAVWDLGQFFLLPFSHEMSGLLDQQSLLLLPDTSTRSLEAMGSSDYDVGPLKLGGGKEPVSLFT